MQTTENVTTESIGSGATEIVYLSSSGQEIGSVISDGPGTRALATMAGSRRFGMYRFATREDAIAACVSYATRGYWTGEID